MDESVLLEIIKDAVYALSSKSLCLVYQTYGKALMARKLEAITRDEFMQLNDMLIVNGVNNPAAGLE